MINWLSTTPIINNTHCVLHLGETPLNDPIVQEFIHHYTKAKKLGLNVPPFLHFTFDSSDPSLANNQGVIVEDDLGHHSLTESLETLKDLLDRHAFFSSHTSW
jgi:hypothetical protein